ncbi:hypothetical protein AMJ52_04650 [candidate division TA06 bacterium DG_78]|uniref:Fibronectin type-III domain-containing protein n=1 Tax=candidate division TA06 bacterium DG_78 TaxID=1703772 RepID=A0A0S7YE00_UNCT6|nr:MAG: hypothetical protein AMJ52_04650 [candidate division TA06 bacterium DG_78]
MRKIFLGTLTILVIFIFGCGGAALLDAPEITGIIFHEASVTITWQADAVIENNVDFNGYNIYVSTDSVDLLVEDAENFNKINAIVITGNTYTTPTTLHQDSIYYVQVRTVNIDNKVGSYNSNVPFVAASPRPEFTATLSFEVYPTPDYDSCAIRFSDATIMADSAMPYSGADMWIDWPTKFVSPNNHPQYGANSRETNFVNLGQYELDDISEVTTEPTESNVEVDEGDLVICMTEDSNYVKIHVDEIIPIDSSGFSVTITYAYQNIANFPYLSP